MNTIFVYHGYFKKLLTAATERFTFILSEETKTEIINTTTDAQDLVRGSAALAPIRFADHVQISYVLIRRHKQFVYLS